MANIGMRVPYIPTGSVFPIFAPTGPTQGDQFGVKNVSPIGPTGVYLDGNSHGIENPLQSYTTVASFYLTGDGISVLWEYDGTNWNVI
jgi:hypothetical protein